MSRLGLLRAFGCVTLLSGCVRGEPMILSESPDHRQVVDVLSEQFFWELFVIHGPGDGSSGPGRVRLVSADGEVLRSAQIPMLCAVEPRDITWIDDAVEIKLVATWPRPRD